MTRALLLLLTALSGCGLFQKDLLDFRTYPLEGVGYEDAVALVQEVVVQEFGARWGGGFELDYDPDTGNLVVTGISDETRTLTYYVKIVPRGDDTLLEMLALVRPAVPPGVPGAPRAAPMQDVRFEEVMYDAFVLESVKRFGPGT